jgi:hypothetical protein
MLLGGCASRSTTPANHVARLLSPLVLAGNGSQLTISSPCWPRPNEGRGLGRDPRGIARAGLGAYGCGCRDWRLMRAGVSQWIAVSFPNAQRTTSPGRPNARMCCFACRSGSAIAPPPRGWWSCAAATRSAAAPAIVRAGKAGAGPPCRAHTRAAFDRCGAPRRSATRYRLQQVGACAMPAIAVAPAAGKWRIASHAAMRTFPRVCPCPSVPESVRNITQGVPPIDDRHDLVGFDELLQNGQVLSVVPHDEHAHPLAGRTEIARAP